ncbi:phage baseplate protein [Enterobacter sp.]|uniref:phage baseplate protein n=1 Tax=Enterobacter sp. TaxID=42895 RepID=UPI003D09ACA4
MDILSAIIRHHSRLFGVKGVGLIVPDVVVSEKHSDVLEITRHPVEVGAAVSDHAYRQPSDVIMECGFSGGGSLVDFSDTTNIGLRASLSPKEMYQNILDLQASRQPIEVITGKRTYSNMLIRSIEVTTDRNTENVLMATLTMREVLITQTTPVQVADKTAMSTGVNTSAVVNTGTKNPLPADESLLKGGHELFWGGR